METAPGLVGVMECGVGHLQCVSVSGMDFIHCIKSRTEILICSDLTLITNGDNIVYSEGSPHNRRPINTVAFYSCNPGYSLNLTGGSPFRTCLKGGIWSGSAPTCQGEF